MCLTVLFHKERFLYREDLEKFYTLYEEVLIKYNIKQQNIWNCDETMVNVHEGKEKVIRRNDHQPPCRKTHGEHMTLLLFISAAGESQTPLIILPLKTVPPLDPEVQKQFHFAGQSSGWMTGQIFKNIVENGFSAAIESKRVNKNEPVLLIFDHHSSRDSIDAEKLWNDHKILLLIIPPHSSALTQPLEVSVNGELKRLLSERFVDIPEESLTDRRNRLLQILHRCLSRAQCADIILNGFERTGLWPFNPQVVYNSAMVLNSVKPKPSVEAGKKRKI
jgi:hypothetical protein